MDFKLDIELKITAKPLTPKTGLQTRVPYERNMFVVTEKLTRFLYGAAKADIATLAADAIKVPLRSWALSTTEPPECRTLPATSVTIGGYTLNGSVHPHATSTAISFDHGTTIALGTNSAADSGTPSSLDAWTAFSYTRSSGVTADTQYYFRVKAVQGSLTLYGQILTFKTPAS